MSVRTARHEAREALLDFFMEEEISPPPTREALRALPPDWRDAILDFVLTKAFTEGFLAVLMADLWDYAYALGRLDSEAPAR